MKVARPVLVTMGSVGDKRHHRDFSTRQPRRDVAVVVETDGGNFPGPDDLGCVILGHPDVWRLHTCLPPTNYRTSSRICAYVPAGTPPVARPPRRPGQVVSSMLYIGQRTQ